MIKASWIQFVLLQIPGAALVLALVVQVLAFGLSSVPMLRDRPDELALAVLKGPTNYRTLLFGDSVTRFATLRFSLGTQGEVANLTTHKTLGLIGSLFLLQRYLSAHPSPERVVIVQIPALYHYKDDAREARYNLWYTFGRQDERDFLRTYFPGIDARDWLPAVLDIQERLIEPFFSILAQWRQPPRIEDGSLIANGDAPVEFAARAETDDDQVFLDKRDLAPSAMNTEALRMLCNLGKKHGFKIDIAWPPMPAQLEKLLTSDGQFTQLETRIRSIMDDGHCDFEGFTDFNRIRTYPNLAFRNDLTHLFGDGWEQRYTADMVKYLNGSLNPIPGSGLAIDSHAIEAGGVGGSLPEVGPSDLAPCDECRMPVLGRP
jgi:hypothetical protein